MAMYSWLYATLGHYVLAVPGLWIVLEILHYLGLSLMLGALLVMDLRLIGLTRRLPLQVTHDLVAVVYVGFGLNLVTGVMFFVTNPAYYAANSAFQIKMWLMLFACLNALIYQFRVLPKLASWPETEPLPLYTRVVAVSSLLLWMAVVYFGRVIPYL